MHKWNAHLWGALVGTLVLIGSSAPLFAEADKTEPATSSDSIFQMSLDDLLNAKITVTSEKPLTTRETPGIVTVITEDEIRNMGARDLIDVLQMVPGVGFGMDVQGVVGLAFRGNWAHEGKVLLIIDDHEMNEMNYSTNQFGHHYPVEQIKKIEIIRGPGSVIYGGFAELAVIKVTTKGAEELNGFEASGRYGQMAHIFGRQDLSLQAGKTVDDFKFKIGAFVGKGNRSDRDFVDFYGNSYNLARNAQLNNVFLNTDFSYKDLNVKFLYDNYGTTYQDGYTIVFTKPVAMNFYSYLTKIKYDIRPRKDLTITPALTLDRFQPWHSVGTDAYEVQNTTDQLGNSIYGANLTYNRRTDRVKAAVVASYDMTEQINFLTGLEKSYFGSHDSLSTFATSGTNSVSYNSYALYGQSILSSVLANFTLGARYEVHNQFGSAFVPRAAVTKIIDKFHFKLLASRSFRAPSMENINSNPDIKPEKTTVYEFEAGYQLSSDIFIVSNLFDIKVDRPIVYTVSPGVNDSYTNFDVTGSRGVELEVRHIGKDSYSTLGYSFYTSAGKNGVSAYQVPDRNNVVLGIPAHKLTLNSNQRIVGNWFFNPQMIFLSNRFGYDYAGEPSSVFTDSSLATESTKLVSFSPTWLVNAHIRSKDLFVRNLNFGVGIFNLLNQDFRYIQPYYTAGNGRAPLPGSSREFVLDINYRREI